MLKYKSSQNLKLAAMIKKRQKRVKKAYLKATLGDFLYTIVSLIIFTGLFNLAYEKIHQGDILATEVVEEALAVEETNPNYGDSTTVKDERVTKLEKYLKSKNSPLSSHASLIVSEADKYDIGWTKLVAISAMESAYGKRVPEGSHNAWGLGGSNFMYFESWDKSIQYASKLLGNKYQLNENQGIKNKYCPSSDGCNPDWAGIVTRTSTEILSLNE